MPRPAARRAACLLALALLALGLLPWPARADDAPLPRAPAPTGFAPPGASATAGTAWSVQGWPALNAAQSTIVRVLARNQVAWDGVTGPVVGFRPGASYDRIYARDLATILPFASYLYGDAYLRTAVEEFLALQYDRAADPTGYPGLGSISATVFWDHHVDKATVTSDEETSLIHAAYVYYRAAGGPTWLKRDVRGQPVLTRLAAAMDSLLVARLDPATGLVKRGATTDWGDVKMEGGPEPTRLLPGDAQVATIYDQALAFRALRELGEMQAIAGDPERAERYQTLAAHLQRAANRYLWQPDRGYYRIRIPLTPHYPSLDEDAIVSIGNAIAVYAGLADPQQAGAILAALEEARIRAGSVKPGVSLWPVYPLGVFDHPAMYPGAYQNGGVWDWWGGLQVSTEFSSGYSGLARRHLAAIVADWQARGGLVSEWDTLYTHRPAGSADYAGAAATVGEAILEGLFGLRLSLGGFLVLPRLGDLSGVARAEQPATGRYLALEQRVDEATLQLDYSTNHPGPGAASILLPEGRSAGAVTLDGVPADFTVTAGGADWFVVLPSLPSGTHRITVQFP